MLDTWPLFLFAGAYVAWSLSGVASALTSVADYRLIKVTPGPGANST